VCCELGAGEAPVRHILFFVVPLVERTSPAYQMQDEDGDNSLDRALKDKESDGHGASISLTLSDLVHNQHLLVMCAKCPPEDDEPVH